MIKCIVIDDEKPARDELAYLINKTEGFSVIATYESGVSLLKENEQVAEATLFHSEVLFVDINMPGCNGIELVERIKAMAYEGQVVFVTAFDDYAIKAFELHAIDYIMKPVSDERIGKCLRRLREEQREMTYDHKLDQLLTQLGQDKKEKICLHHNGKIVPVKLDEILYCKAENKGTVIYTEQGVFHATLSLADFQKKIHGENFFRCHRSFLININYIVNIEPWFNRTYQVAFKDIEEKIPVSRNYVQRFKEIMNIF